jgi:mannan endo-1,4-beta-mannosidase
MPRPFVLACASAALLAVAAPAYAAWTTSGSVARTATATTLAAPGAPTASNVTQTSATISWTAAAPMPTGAISYVVERALFGTTDYVAACTSASTPLAGTSCSDTGLAAGTDYQYRVTSVYGNWRTAGATSAKVSTQAAAVSVNYKLTMTAMTERQNKEQWKVGASITLVDATGAPLQGYTISGTWTPGSQPATCLTGADGKCSTGLSGNISQDHATSTLTPTVSKSGTNPVPTADSQASVTASRPA